MYPKTLEQLDVFLLKKKQRFVDIFLWHLHLDGKANSLNSLGLHEDVKNCRRALRQSKALLEYKDEEELLNVYFKKCDLSLVPDEYISWIEKGNARQCNFIWIYIKNLGLLNEASMLSTAGNSNKYHVIIKALDRIERSEQKWKLLKNLRKDWEYTRSYNGWRYQWLDINNDSQCEKAVKFLSKKVSPKSLFYNKPPLANDDNELSDYYKFLASVDIWDAPPEKKITFHGKSIDAARKWKTPEQKKVQVKLKSKAKENNHVLLKDKKSLALLQSIKEQMEHESLSDTLRYILNEKHDEIFKLSNIQEAEPKAIEVNKSLCDLKSFEILKERASSQLRTLCDYSIKLQKADIFDNKMSKSAKQKAKELFKSKEIKLFDGLG